MCEHMKVKTCLYALMLVISQKCCYLYHKQESFLSERGKLALGNDLYVENNEVLHGGN